MEKEKVKREREREKHSGGDDKVLVFNVYFSEMESHVTF